MHGTRRVTDEDVMHREGHRVAAELESSGLCATRTTHMDEDLMHREGHRVTAEPTSSERRTARTTKLDEDVMHRDVHRVATESEFLGLLAARTTRRRGRRHAPRRSSRRRRARVPGSARSAHDGMCMTRSCAATIIASPPRPSSRCCAEHARRDVYDEVMHRDVHRVAAEREFPGLRAARTTGCV